MAKSPFMLSPITNEPQHWLSAKKEDCIKGDPKNDHHKQTRENGRGASAAREAVMQGKAALATSCYCREFKDVEYLAHITAQVAELLLENPLPSGVFLNLNMPNLTREQNMPFAYAPMGW